MWATPQTAFKVAVVRGVSQECTILEYPSCIKTSNVIIKLGTALSNLMTHHREGRLPALFKIHPCCNPPPPFNFASVKICPVCNIWVHTNTPNPQYS